MAIIGIDLGTSNSAAAVFRGGRPVLIPSEEGVTLGGKAFPSFVAVVKEGQILVGEPARRQLAANPGGTTTAFKRRMGRREKIRLRDREFSAISFRETSCWSSSNTFSCWSFTSCSTACLRAL